MSIGFDSSNTFKAFISKVAKADSGDVKKTLLDVKKIVDTLIFKNVAFTNKRVFFYDIPKENLSKIFDSLQKNNEYFLKGENSTSFNYNLIDHDHVETSLVLSDEDTSFKVIYLKSGRNRPDIIHPKNKEHLFGGEFGDIIDITLKVQYVMNAFDFFAFDFKNNILVVGMDLDGIFPTAETNKSQGNYVRDLRKLANLQSLKAKNLRNCVANLEFEKIGSVLNHSFMTADRGFNHAGNSITSNQDIRNDDFHKDGIKDKEADFYGIKKLFPLENDEKVVLTVRMTFRDYKLPNASIYSALIDNVTSYNGLKYAIRKVIEHNHN
ncbi:hypothetical protein [Acinetobacter sp. NBRC 100985]|uniref:hypothetical protein n=1 Tax=Acinetobacter sp. NBRC 100985 TaxID=1071390 RepID=UPI000235FC93|nr:hypothetical protein [Acinetobacter sp. NBRC 100985]GAB03228.1 hypothetical protein ACT4_053_00280 [Acinetobacter sp. NBRC 100985]